MFLILKNLVYFIDFWKISEQGSEMCTGHGKSEKKCAFSRYRNIRNMRVFTSHIKVETPQAAHF